MEEHVDTPVLQQLFELIISERIRKGLKAGDAKTYSKIPKVFESLGQIETENRQKMIEEEKMTNWEKYHDATDSDQSFPPLHSAAKDGQTSMAKALLENQADPSKPTTKGLTPLHLCANFGHLAIAELLLKYKANVSAVDNYYKLTPLHYAAENGHKELVELLIANGANVNANDCKQSTPLHLASKHGHADIVELLTSKRANVNAKCAEGATPLFGAAMFGYEEVAKCLIRHIKNKNLHIVNKAGMSALEVAVEFGHENIVSLMTKHGAKMEKPLHRAVLSGRTEIAKMLLASGANANYGKGEEKLLFTAILHRRTELIGVLIRHGADPNFCAGGPLVMAVNSGFPDVVEELLKHGVPVKTKGLNENCTLLHLAAQMGYVEVAKILLKYGDNIEALSTSHITPLAYAAGAGHEEMTEVLLAHGANIHFVTDDGTALHIAASQNHPEVVGILLGKEALVMAKDRAGKTALECAVEKDHLSVVEVIANHENSALSQWTKEKWTLLHIATQRACDKKDKEFEMVKLLIAKGANLHTITRHCKPVHIAAREGSIEMVEFFLSKGNDINKDHLLSYAVIEPNMDVVKFLVARGADINAECEGVTPLHVAASSGNKRLVALFLSMGAKYDADAAVFNTMPGAFDEHKDVVDMLKGTAMLFCAAESNYCPGLVEAIKKGAYVNAKNPDGETALCMAMRLGLQKLPKILLENGADPNIADSGGMAPLHYAVQKATVKNVTLLLTRGAIFDAKAAGKTPADLSKNKDISALLALVDVVFKKVSKNDGQVMSDLRAIIDPEYVHAVLGARNSQGNNLMAAAAKANFSKIKELKEYANGEIDGIKKIIELTSSLVLLKEYEKAMTVLKGHLKEVRKMTGKTDDTHSLALEAQIAKVVYKKGTFAEALRLNQAVYKKQKDLLGADARETLETRCTIALVLHRLCRYDEAIAIFTEVSEKQKKLFGENDDDYCNTLFHMALTLHQLGRHEEGLAINEMVYKRRMAKSDTGSDVISMKNNYAYSLQMVGRLDEAYFIFTEVLDAKIMLYGTDHRDTTSTLNCLASILMELNKPREALQRFVKVVAIQKKIHPKNHPEMLMTQFNVVLAYLKLGEMINGYRVLSSIFEPIKATFSPSDAIVTRATQTMHLLQPLFGHMISHMSIFEAASKGDLQEVIRLAEEGQVNDVDSEGRTALHFAVDTENSTMVESLLKHGADATIASKKGNTALHTAALKNNTHIVELLLKNVSRKQLAGYVNAKTTSGGTTAIHIAARGGSLAIIKLLLKHSGIFNIRNIQGKRPLDVAQDASVREFVQTIQNLFKDIAAGNDDSLTTLSQRSLEDIDAITRARNTDGITLYQVALNSGRKELAQKLLEILKASPAVPSL